MPSYIHASKALSASHERQRLLWRTCLPSLARLELPVLMAGTKQARSVANLNLGFLRQLGIFRVLKERRARSIVAGTDASGGEGGEAERGAGAEVGGVGWCNNCGSAQTMQCHTFGAGGSDDGNVSDDAGGDGYDDDVDDGSGSSSTMLKLSLKLRLCQSEFSLGSLNTSFYLKVRNHSYADKTKQ